jgi:hypothetical protein
MRIRHSYFDEEEQNIQEYCYDYPDDRELLEIFPEGKEIINQKLKENDDSRLKRLSALADDNPHLLKWEKAVIRAKAVPIQDIVKLKRLRRTARGYEACCPLHDDKSPSLIIYSDNHFRCFSCQKFGDSIDLYKLLFKVDMKTAVNSLNGGMNEKN